jgi:hypothetical protein
MWARFKGLELEVGLTDATTIAHLLTSCGAPDDLPGTRQALRPATGGKQADFAPRKCPSSPGQKPLFSKQRSLLYSMILPLCGLHRPPESS